MANNYFTRHLASDELRDTLFFATGEVPVKEKTSEYSTLSTRRFNAKIFSDRRIVMNDVKCRSIHEAKLFVQQNLD